MKSIKTRLLLLMTLLLLVACSTDEKKGTDFMDDSEAASRPVNGTTTQGYDSNGAIDETELSANQLGADFSDPQNPLSKQTIYFMYDSSQVQQDFIPVIAAHAQYLVSHPDLHMILEGHADERGSREYNIALGEQRAKAVARMMKLQGVADKQLEIVSYGEEKPAVDGHDEASWQLNRRVELVYQRQS